MDTQVDADRIVHRFISEREEPVAQQYLDTLVYQCAQPVIRGVIKSRFSAQTDWQFVNQEQEDLFNSVIVHLLTELHRIRKSSGRESIRDFNGYVAKLTASVCADYLRKKSPHRTRLQEQLRYVLKRQPGFALWQIGPTFVCGFDKWRVTNQSAISPQKFQRLLESEPEKAWARELSKDFTQLSLPELLFFLFKRIGQPLEFSRLITLIMRLRRISDRNLVAAIPSNGDSMPLPIELISKENFQLKIENTLYLKKLWKEIEKLPLAHRKALLLNLRNNSGKGAIVLLSYLGIASPKQIAALLEIPFNEFAKLWDELPLDDNEIADHLGLQRQQVINLRRSARRMLARQMREEK